MSYKPVLGGVRVAIPKGDLYGGAVAIMNATDYTLFDPAEVRRAHDEKRIPNSLTGSESSREMPPIAYVRDELTGYGFNPKMGVKDIEQIEDASDFIAIIRPQELRRLMLDDGVLDLAVGGYDIEVNYAGLPQIEFNGRIHDPEQRIGVMGEELEKCGYISLGCVEYKPTVHVLIAKRKGGIRYISDLQNGRRRKAKSEFSHMSRLFAEQHRLNTEFEPRDSAGGVDDQVAAGLVDLGHDLLETCSRLKTYAHLVTLVRWNDSGEVVKISFSLPHIIARPDAMMKKEREIHIISDRFNHGVTEAKNNALTSRLFDEKYTGFLEEQWDNIDKGLGFG